LRSTIYYLDKLVSGNIRKAIKPVKRERATTPEEADGQLSMLGLRIA
jgi:hypothetical protein